VDPYQKVPGPYRRYTEGPDRNRLIIGQWSSPELEYLQHVDWIWTEKVDGTNIRVHWDGYKVTYGGRTDNAQIPAKLIQHLDNLFPEEIFEQKFGVTPATLYGEGFGAGIQSGGSYSPDMDFVLFDVKIGGWWLRRDDVVEVATSMGINIVPVVLSGSIHDAIQEVHKGVTSAWNPSLEAEGLVGVTSAGLLDRSGQRLIVKVKSKDFGRVSR
jgi:hypothetical protein